MQPGLPFCYFCISESIEEISVLEKHILQADMHLPLSVPSRIQRKDILSPLLVPEGEVFRPRTQDIEQLQLRDFLGKAKVRTLCRGETELI